MKESMRLVLIPITFFVVACASTPVTRVGIQSFELKKEGVPSNTAVAQVIGVLVDRGFDVKMSNADSGIVTTEYKKFASVATHPPFDYYMQIRAKIRPANGITSVSLIPAVKEQNRLNAVAYTEHELAYFEGDPENLEEIVSMNPGAGWRSLAQTLFMSVVTDTADALGLAMEDVVPNVSRTPVDAGDVEN